MDQLFSHVVYWTWWIIGVLLVILEITAPGTFFLWMGISAGIVGVTLYIIPELAWELQLIMFAILSIATILVSRRYLQKNGEDQSTLSQRGKRYIGMTVVVEEPIANSIGKVRIEDTLWRATGSDTPAGNQVKIIDIEGVTFQVEPVSTE